MPEPPIHFFDLDHPQLSRLMVQWDMPRYRADQLFQWVYQRGLADPAAMTDLSKRDRSVIARRMTFLSSEVVREQRATDGVRKLLLAWPRIEPNPPSRGLQPRIESPSDPSPTTGPSDTHTTPSTPLPLIPAAAGQTECVMIPARPGRDGPTSRDATHPGDDAGGDGGGHPGDQPRGDSGGDFGGDFGDDSGGDGEIDDAPPTAGLLANVRRTACVSSQVGCPVGCTFCASGLDGLEGNLTAGQIVEQVWRLGTLEGVRGKGDDPAQARRPGITHVVFMGMGEPMANFTNVLAAIERLTDPKGLNLSGRRITVSTVGLPAQVRRLAECDLPVTLAVSLHAPNDDLRRRLIPWARYVSIDQLVEAGRYYFERTGREVTLEYILLGGVNDRPEHARELVEVARRLRANVNLIRYNEVKGLPFDRPHSPDVLAFQSILRRARVNTHIRASRGRDIAAACGQLRHEHRAATAR